MEKKIAKTLIICAMALAGCSQNKPNSTAARSGNQGTLNYDTLYYVNDKVDRLVIKNGIQVDNGVAIPVKSMGQTFWLDKLYYQATTDNFSMVISSDPVGEKTLFYSNGDTSFLEKIAINTPKIIDYQLHHSKIISIIDSSYNSGYLIKSFLFYKINREGQLLDKREYFSQKKIGQDRYDTLYSIKVLHDSILIYKDGIVIYTYPD